MNCPAITIHRTFFLEVKTPSLFEVCGNLEHCDWMRRPMGGVTFLFSVGFFFVSQPPLPTPFQIPPPPPKKKKKTNHQLMI
jgi:hypothetical protein